MRKVSIFLAIVNFMAIKAIAQKPTIDSSVFGKWPSIYTFGISSDGNYSMTTIYDNKKMEYILNILSNSSPWKMQITNKEPLSFSFSNNSRQAFFLKSNDSLGMLDLGKMTVRYISGIKSFNLPEKGHWIAWQQKGNIGKLVLRNVVNEKELIFSNVINYWFSKDGRVLLIERSSKYGNDIGRSLDWVDLKSENIVTVWSGYRLLNHTFDDSCRQLAFTVIDKVNDTLNDYTVYLYQRGMEKASSFIKNQSQGFEYGYKIGNGQLSFSRMGDKLLFQLEKIDQNTPVYQLPNSEVIIWDYKDEYLRSEKLLPQDTTTIFYAVKSKRGDKVVRLNDRGQQLVVDKHFQDYFLLYKGGSSIDFYDASKRVTLYVVNANNGYKDILVAKKQLYQYALSPDEHFVLWYDPDSLSYYSYEVPSKTIRNISRNIPVPLYNDENVKAGRRVTACFNIAAWDVNSHSVCLYDKYDIWSVDLQSGSLPINVTNGYGRRNNIVFSLMNFDIALKVVERNLREKTLLVGFERGTKSNGFWKTSTDNLNPIKKCMDPCAYYVPRTGTSGLIASHANGKPPVKAKNAQKIIVEKMTASDFPNLYLTSDFRSFKAITNIHPEKEYNWVKAELLSWQLPDGEMSQGILYKPEDFDSTKKYSLIFDYYEKRSDELHEFIPPNFSSDRINIPFYVSNGYLIFVPDIYYQQGHNGKGVVDAVTSAAKFLSAFSWVDSSRLGLQGHSFGGWETNFLITHSHLFAAACEASGVSDQVSAYGQLRMITSGGHRQGFYEIGSQGSAFGVGVTPWTHPELYIENSPIFFANNVTTPLLMMHGDQDLAVPYPQALEMFLALRRAGKKVWLLEYPNSGHGVSGQNAKDYTIRMKQFFDYYLKGAPAAKWMTDDLPVSERESKAGLDPDMSSKEPFF